MFGITLPEASTVATEGIELFHVPVPESVNDDDIPIQPESMPLIAAGSALTVMVVVVVQLELFVKVIIEMQVSLLPLVKLLFHHKNFFSALVLRLVTFQEK